MKPYPYQEEDLRKLEAANWVGLLNIEMSGGKTAEACWAIQRSGAETVLIIAPDQTHATAWGPTVAEILGKPVRVLGGTGKAKKEALTDFELGFPGVYISTPQFVTRADITGWHGDFLIVDEGHMLTGPGTAGARKLSGGSSVEHEVSLAKRFPRRLFLSGTAWRNSFERAWQVARFVCPELDKRREPAHSNRWVWLSDRMDHVEVQVGFTWKKCSWKFYNWFRERGKHGVDGEYVKLINGEPHHGKPKLAKKWLTESEPGKLVSEMPCVIIHKRWERCCEHHPEGFLKVRPPKPLEHTVSLHAKQKKALKELQEQMLTWLDDNPLVVDLPITLLLRQRQICLAVPTIVDDEVTFAPNAPSPFADEVERLLSELDGENVVVWTASQKFAEYLTARLNKNGFPAREYSGATKKVRMDSLKEFGKEFSVLVATISSLGTGADGLQKVSSTSIWCDLDLDMTNNIQAEGRLSRTGAIRDEERHMILDSEGYAQGRLDDQVARRLELSKTLRLNGVKGVL